MQFFLPVRRICAIIVAFSLSTIAIPSLSAAVIRGQVTDSTGAAIHGAAVLLYMNGKSVSQTVSASDGSFQLSTGKRGHLYLIISAPSFREMQTPGFYAASSDLVERNIVLEPAWVRESIVVTATGTPTPQAQTNSAISVLTTSDTVQSTDFTSALRLMPGTFVVQTGQRGSQTSLFVRGGDSDANAITIDGISAGDLGGRFDFGAVSTTGVESTEVYRGPNSSLYGADASASVVSYTTPHGTTSFPSFFYQGDAGNLHTYRNEAQLAGTYSSLDYYFGYSRYDTSNSLPRDEFHVGTTSANVGWQPSAQLQVRGTLRYGVSNVALPNAWNFYHVADDANQKDQDLYIGAMLEYRPTLDFHNTLRYGAVRKREQYAQWAPVGELLALPSSYDANGNVASYYGYYFGNAVTIRGANGTSASGRAVIDYGTSCAPDDLGACAGLDSYPGSVGYVNERDQLLYEGDYRFTQHITGLIGFRFENETGVERDPAYAIDDVAGRANWDYLAEVHGDFKNRLFYTLGGSLQHYQLFGTQTSPRGGLSFYAVRPHSGIFSGTRLNASFSEAVREPALTDQFDSLYAFLASNGYQSTASALHIGHIAAPTTRTYEAGIEQSFLSQHIVLRASYFHNEFGKQIESVGAQLIPNLIPNLSSEQRQQLINALGYYYEYDEGLSINSQAYRAQGIESTLEGGIGSHIFLRGGYTWMEAVVQRSFSSDNEALLDGYAPTYNGIPIGAYSPLKGARPFRRAPNTGFFTASYTNNALALEATGAFASRSDDSTYLEYSDLNLGNSMLLPNRNLDYGWAKIDLGGSYQLKSWLAIYGNAENLLNNQHIAPIGYPALPFNFHAGLRFSLGKGTK